MCLWSTDQPFTVFLTWNVLFSVYNRISKPSSGLPCEKRKLSLWLWPLTPEWSVGTINSTDHRAGRTMLEFSLHALFLCTSIISRLNFRLQKGQGSCFFVNLLTPAPRCKSRCSVNIYHIQNCSQEGNHDRNWEEEIQRSLISNWETLFKVGKQEHFSLQEKWKLQET